MIRVSGDDALNIVQQRWRGKPIAEMASHTAHFGHVLDSLGEILDEAVLTLFRAPNSFTGEDVVEISCHGSMWIQQQIVSSLIDAGCRAATGGEFTQRAFANGKMDLSQAEAIADVIASGSRAAHRVAMNQMRGAFGRQLSALRSQLLEFVSLIELELVFSEEDVSFADRSRLIDLATNIHGVIGRLSRSFAVGNAIKHGVPVAIVGASNAGKSTLLNGLLRDDRALVSDIAGTTRDVIENMGIERSFQKMDEAQIVLWVIDATTGMGEAERLAATIAQRCAGKQLIAVVNKTDVAAGEPIVAALQQLLPEGTAVMAISAKSSADVERLEQLIVERAMLPEVDSEALIVTNARHYEALVRAGEAIERSIEGLRTGVSGDFVSQDIRECMHYLGEITGEISTNDILGEIFARFCIGK